MMRQTKHLRPNGVKGSGTSRNRTSPGGSVSPQQDTFDRQPVTACNLREKTRIAAVYVLCINQESLGVSKEKLVVASQHKRTQKQTR